MATAARVVVLPEGDASAGLPSLEVQEVRLPAPGPRQVVVKQHASGICHSQLHQMHRPRRRPVLLGHEATGTVLQAGREVGHVAEGDTVLVTWVPRDAARASAPPTPAALEVGVGCAVMTGAGAVLNTADVQRGDSVAIFGVGGVGLSAVAGAKVRGADPIIAVDVDDAKLAFARRFGATHGVNARQEDPVAAIHRMAGKPGQTSIAGRPVTGVDFAFDCIGHKATMEQIVPACRPGHFGACQGGTAVLVGVPHATVELNAGEMLGQEKQFRGSIGGSCSPDRDFPMFLKWHAEGQLDLDALVTARYAIDDVNEATHALAEGRISGRSILEF